MSRASRVRRLLRVLDRDPVDHDIGAIAAELGISEGAVRRLVRDRREAGSSLPPPHEQMGRSDGGDDGLRV